MNPTIDLLKQYSLAIEHDLHSSNGYSIGTDLTRITNLLESATDYPAWGLEWQRIRLGLCLAGEGHWAKHCTNNCKDGAVA